MNDELAARIDSTKNCLLHLRPVKAGMTAPDLADLLWRATGVNFDPSNISITPTRVDPNVATALILVPREVIADWLNRCINPTTGISVMPAEFGTGRPGAHQERKNDRLRSKILTNRNGIPRLQVMGDKR